MKQPSYVGFKSKEYHWKPNIDYRENPHLYKVGRGQQGVLICQPYKSELHIHWRFKTPEQAKQSAQTIYMMFLDYLKQEDFVGADMAKKGLVLGWFINVSYKKCPCVFGERARVDWTVQCTASECSRGNRNLGWDGISRRWLYGI